jgi:hypothetical protein
MCALGAWCARLARWIVAHSFGVVSCTPAAAPPCHCAVVMQSDIGVLAMARPSFDRDRKLNVLGTRRVPLGKGGQIATRCRLQGLQREDQGAATQKQQQP